MLYEVNVRLWKKTIALRFENVKFDTNFAQPFYYLGHAAPYLGHAAPYIVPG
jgi:hypothetical protein